MNLLVAVDNEWGIGYQGNLQVRLSEDMKYFRQLTEGHTIIFGRKTLATFPGGRPLPLRTNIVLTRQHDLAVPGLHVCHNLIELAELLEQLDSLDNWLIGGQSIYRQMLPYCNLAYVTRIDRSGPADVYFPDLDKHSDWILVDEQPWQIAQNKQSTMPDMVRFRFTRYQNRHIRPLSQLKTDPFDFYEAAGNEEND